MGRFAIQHDTLADGWVNTWSDHLGNPVYFASRAVAEDELREFLADVQDEVTQGNIGPYDVAEFRIVGLHVV